MWQVYLDWISVLDLPPYIKSVPCLPVSVYHTFQKLMKVQIKKQQ